ncbi:cytosine permease [Boseaceae bacterium BT-24-1]|nr:cytosine permease [Boseaceae bacterium BT-24-1]
MDIERRSIDFIPETERYGSAWRLFTLWFSNNLTLPSAVVGTLGLVFGLNLFWTCVAIVLGNFIGQLFTSAHSAQGPHLGIPQMIQSRAQFGVLGAMVPLAVVCVSYTVTTAAFEIIGSGPLAAISGLSPSFAIVLFGAVTVIVCFLGYELIHRLAFVMTIASGLLFAGGAVLMLQHPLPENAFGSAGFNLPVFLLMVTQAVSVSLGFGVYVADYSRYLPSNTPTASTYFYTFSGNFLGGSLVMIFGALLANIVPDAVNNTGTAAASLFGVFQPVAYVVLVLSVMQINILNVYSTYMSMTSIFTGFRGQASLTNSTKFILILAATTISTAIALATQESFFVFFSNILIGQLYFLVPWSAINLTDFYLVRKGAYSVEDMYDVNGIYGRYNIPGLVAYASAIIAQVPFMGFSFYSGPMHQLIGADVAWVVGLVVPSIAYFLAMRGQRLRASRFSSAMTPARF